MRVLVTGGAGFIGSHLVDLLLKEGDEVTILDDNSAGTEQNLTHMKGAYIIKGDLANAEVVDYACSFADLIYHLGARINVDESLEFPLLYHHANATGTLNVLKAVKRRDLKLVHMSSSEVYGTAERIPMDETHPLNPRSPYAASKLAAEKYVFSYCTSFGTKATILRSFNNYGPRQKGNKGFGGLISRNLVRLLMSERPVIRGGSQKRDYVFVKDTARALFMLRDFDSKAYGRAFNVGFGTSYSASEIIAELENVCRQWPEPILEPSRPGDVIDMVCDYSLFKREYGWEPEYDLKCGLHESAEWYRSNLERYKQFTFVTDRQEIGNE